MKSRILRVCAPYMRPDVTCVALALACSGGGASVDIKIVTEIAVSGGQNAQMPRMPSALPKNSGSQSEDAPTAPAQKVTIYYKGEMARRETARGPITLYDGAKNQVTILNPADKTYSVFATKDAFKWLKDDRGAFGQDAFGAKLPEGMRQDTRVDLDKTGLAQSLFDAETQKYTLAARLQVVMDSAQGLGGHGGRSGGGSYGGRRRGGRQDGDGYPDGGQGGYSPTPGGGQGRGRSSGYRAMPLTEIQGDFWLAEDDLLPAGDKSPLLPLLQGTVSDIAVLKSLYGKIAKLKCVPLSTSVTSRVSSPIGEAHSPLVTTTMQVKSITRSPLDKTLFEVPAGYQKSRPEAVLRQNISYRMTEHR